MKPFRMILLVALTGGAFAAQAQDVLVTLVKDKTCLYLEKGAWVLMTPFMKLRAGDRLELGAGCATQLLYTASGRQETWSGRVELTIGEARSEAIGDAIPVVKQLPVAALARLSRAPLVLTDIRSRTGMVMVRSGGVLEKLRAVESLYEEMRAAAGNEDITPELYLLSALYELELYRDVEEIIADIVARQPDNAEAQLILENMRKAMKMTGDTPETH